ncbi:MAG: hypothetical protein AAGH15_14140 [Myxococcota bacterium]
MVRTSCVRDEPHRALGPLDDLVRGREEPGRERGLLRSFPKQGIVELVVVAVEGPYFFDVEQRTTERPCAVQQPCGKATACHMVRLGSLLLPSQRQSHFARDLLQSQVPVDERLFPGKVDDVLAHPVGLCGFTSERRQVFTNAHGPTLPGLSRAR